MKKLLLAAAGIALSCLPALAQDGRGTQPEPSFPTGCTQVQATKYMVSTTTLNIDPYNPTAGSAHGGTGTQGTLGATGGTSLEPSSTSSPTFTSSEVLDNTTASGGAGIQTALNSSPSHNCVEVVANGAKNGIVLAPIQLPSGVTLFVDGNITVNGSRNPADYGGGSCGTIPTGSSSSSCGTHWIKSAGTTSGSAIMGYGVFNERGWDKFTSNSTCGGLSFCGFSYNRIQSYCNDHGGAINGSPACTPTGGASGIAYGPDLIHLSHASSVILYKATFEDCSNFCVYWGDNASGLTVWDIKIIAPFEVSNTDGFDPSYKATNISLVNSFISNGDNHIAIKSDSGSKYTAGATSNISIINLTTGAGIGVVTGSDVSGGVSNIMVSGLNQKGNLNNGQSTGLGSTNGVFGSSDAGLVNNMSFTHVCEQNENRTIYFPSPGGSGQNNNISLTDVHVLAGVSPWHSGQFIFQGRSSGSKLGLTLDNVIADGTISGSGSNQNANVTLGPDPVSSSILATIPNGTSGVTWTDNRSNSNAPYVCPTWPALTGEVYMKVNSTDNLTTYSNSGVSSATVTLQYVLQPTTAVSIKEAAVPSQPVQFYDNGSPVGSPVAIGGNGTYGSLTLTGVSGSHTYSAVYTGDSNYPGTYSFGNATLTLGAGAPTVATPALSPTPGSFTGTQAVTISDSTPGATIYYTTDGSTPTTSSSVYTSALSVSSTTTVKALAVLTGYVNSAVATGLYTITAPAVAAPTCSPTAGAYGSTQSVTLSSTTGGASIYYTTNGTTPTTGSTLYTGAIPVATSESILSMATHSGDTNSVVSSCFYRIAGTPNPPSGTIDASQIKSSQRQGNSGTSFLMAKGAYFTGDVVTYAADGSGVDGGPPAGFGTAGSGLFSAIISAVPTQTTLGMATSYSHSGTYSQANNPTGFSMVETTSCATTTCIEGVVKAYPSTPFTATVLLSWPYYWVTGNGMGIVVANTTTGQAMFFGLLAGSSSGTNWWEPFVGSFTTPTSYNANVSVGPAPQGTPQGVPIWLKYQDSGTNITFSVSYDGSIYLQAYTVAKSSSFLGGSGFNFLGLVILPQGVAGSGFLGSTVMSYSD